MAVAAALQPKSLATPGELPHCRAKAAAGACDAVWPLLKVKTSGTCCAQLDQATHFERLAGCSLQPQWPTKSLSRHSPVC